MRMSQVQPLRGRGLDVEQTPRKIENVFKEFTSASVDCVDEEEKEKWAVVMQNISLVYGDFMLGSENWVRYRSALAGAVSSRWGS